MAPRFEWRNPSLWGRVLIVAGVLTMPGFLAGEMTSLFFGSIVLNSTIGALIGAALGAIVEAWPPSAPK